MNKKNLTGYLDALIDQDGLKTDITVSLPPKNLLQLAVTLVGVIGVGSILYFTIRGIAYNLEAK